MTQPQTTKFAPIWQLVPIACCGAWLSGIGQATVFRGMVGFEVWSLKWLPIFVGNTLVTLGLLGGFLVLRIGRNPDVAFRLGCAVGLASWMGSWLQGILATSWWLVLSLIFFAGFLHFLRLRSPSIRVLTPVFGGVLVATSWLWLFAPKIQPDNLDLNLDMEPLPVRSATELRTGPDLVLISVDTLRADALFTDRIGLPHLDEFRKQSLWAEYGWAPAPATLPSHATMMTGLGVLQHGANKNTKRVPDSLSVLPEIFRDHGWHTVGLTSSTVVSEATGFHRGFEIFKNLVHLDLNLAKAKDVLWGISRGTWFGALTPARFEMHVFYIINKRRMVTDMAVARGATTRDQALSYLDQLLKQSRPYFLFLHFMDPHQPYAADPRFAGTLANLDEYPDVYQNLDPSSLGTARFLQAELPLGKPETKEALAVLRDLYLEEVMFMDDCMGRILAKIREGGRPTAVIFTSDHGEQFGEHNLMLHNNSVYETLLRVPFILQIPGEEPRKMGQVPRLLDIGPTLLTYCGLDVPAHWKGRNLLQDSSGVTHLGVSLDEIAYYRDHWKLIASYSRLGDPNAEVQATALYDLANDPGELSNLIDEQEDLVQDMLAHVITEVRTAKVAGQALYDARQVQDIVDLGYAGDDEEDDE